MANVRNGRVPAKPRKPQKPRATATPSPAAEPAPPPPAAPASGRLLSAVPPGEPSFWWDPWLPDKALTLLVGDPGAGKSSLGAYLCSLAKRPAILPGHEEDIEAALAPRLRSARVQPDHCLLLDGRNWTMPDHRTSLVAELKAHRADLLWIDPIDSYVGELNENEGPAVRSALEAFGLVAREAGLPVVAARHPGKAAGNYCPGSRQWRAVPREILELRYDAGPPAVRVLRARKDPYSQAMPPHLCELVGDPGRPPRWVLRGPLSAELAAALGGLDEQELHRTDEAVHLIESLLAAGELEAREVYAYLEGYRLAERTIRRAATRAGVVHRREGQGKDHRVYWSIGRVRPTPADPDTHPPGPHSAGGGGV